MHYTRNHYHWLHFKNKIEFNSKAALIMDIDNIWKTWELRKPPWKLDVTIKEISTVIVFFQKTSLTPPQKVFWFKLPHPHLSRDFSLASYFSLKFSLKLRPPPHLGIFNYLLWSGYGYFMDHTLTITHLIWRTCYKEQKIIYSISMEIPAQVRETLP